MAASDPRRPDLDFAVAPLLDLHEVLAELRAREPVSRIVFAGRPTWLLNDYETVSRHISSDEVLSGPAAYEPLSLTTVGRVLPTMSGRQHRLNRAVVSRVFFPGRMRDYAQTFFAEEARRLAQGLAGRERVDLVEAFTRVYTFNNIARILGLPRKHVDRLQGWADRLMRSFADLEDATAAGQEMAEYLVPLIEERRASPKEDVISLLTRATVDGEGLSDEEVLAFCRNLFPAAIDTSTNSLGSLLRYALQDRKLWRALPLDPELREKAVHELLRWEPPLVMIPRRVVREVELGGHRLEVGDDVRLCITGAHDDPRHFERPREFLLDRGASNLTFGHGEHFCLGTQMAKRVLEKGVEILAATHPDMTLCADEENEIVGGVLRGPKSLWVRPTGA
jgi:cytochrome P450